MYIIVILKFFIAFAYLCDGMVSFWGVFFRLWRQQ